MHLKPRVVALKFQRNELGQQFEEIITGFVFAWVAKVKECLHSCLGKSEKRTLRSNLDQWALDANLFHAIDLLAQTTSGILLQRRDELENAPVDAM